MEIHINLRARLFVSQYLFVTQYLRNSIFFQLLAQEYQLHLIQYHVLLSQLGNLHILQNTEMWKTAILRHKVSLFM